MKTYQITYENRTQFVKELERIREERDRKHYYNLMLYYSWASEVSSLLDTVIQCIEECFPDALHYGNESSGNIFRGKLAYGLTVNCVCFEERDSYTKLLWVEDGTEFASLDDLWDYCRHEENLRGVELIPTSGYCDYLGIDGSIPDISSDVLIFGGAAINYINPSYMSRIIFKGHPMTDVGMLAVLYYGSNLNLSSTYVLGWKGLGRYMQVSKSYGKVLSEIDGMPAFSVYEKYLNMTAESDDSIVFPLIVEEDGVEYIRTPQGVLPDKSIKMVVNIKEGALVRIAYGDRNTILNSLYEKASDIAAFRPQAMKVFSCAARKFFWGDEDVYKETLPLCDIAPLFGFYTGGEILRFGRRLRVLNSTLCIINLREGEKDNNEQVYTVKFDKNDRSLIARVTHFVGKMAEEQEEQKVQLQEALNLAQAANRSKTTFLNNMSHDMRTPMNAIIGYTRLASNHIDDKEHVQDYLNKIGQSSDHLLSLINDVLDMSRIESGKMTLEEQEEKLGDIISTLRVITQTDVEKKNLKFCIDYGGVSDGRIICDKLRLKQVLLNILSNAIKYTPDGGAVSMKVDETEGSEPGKVKYVFTITDSGIGMDKEFIKTIFDPFTRVRSTTVSGIQGTGLGMPIVKNIVEMMGGTVAVSSEPGRGTEVVVEIEFRRSNCEEKPVAGGENTGEEEMYNFSGRKILLVEDNELNREILSEILKEFGFVIDTAEDGSVAVDKVSAAAPGDYDIILMDVQMPTMNGYEATRRIRSMNSPLADIPILAMTANAFEEDRNLALEVGMNEHIAKPVDIERLKQVLGMFLR